MKFLFFPLLLVAAAPTPEQLDNKEKFTFTPDLYTDSAIFYEGEHDITDIVVPLNAASDIENGKNLKNMQIFFVKADIDENGRKDYKGICLYKDEGIYDIMENGRAIAASADSSSDVFLGGDDGLYLYDSDTMSVEKYSDFNYSIKDMAKESYNDIIYVLTDEGEVYKIYDEGTQIEKIDELDGAEQIVVDYANNLYYYGGDKQPYVRNNEGQTIKIEGLPKTDNVKLLRPMIIEEGAEFLADDELYVIFPNGKSEAENYEFTPDSRPTAFSMETVVFKYLAYDKKIYEFSIFPGKDEDEDDEDNQHDEKYEYKEHAEDKAPEEDQEDEEHEKDEEHAANEETEEDEEDELPDDGEEIDEGEESEDDEELAVDEEGEEDEEDEDPAEDEKREEDEEDKKPEEGDELKEVEDPEEDEGDEEPQEKPEEDKEPTEYQDYNADDTEYR